MNPLFYNYHISAQSNNRTRMYILYLLHELRIVSRNQIAKFLEVDYDLSVNAVDKVLKSLSDQELISKYKNGRQPCYYLTKEGHLSIGGLYSLPKVPEYNLQHHLEINDYLLDTIDLIGEHPNLKFMMSERRQVYETKDFQENSKGRKYFVPDFICRFVDSEETEIDWSFEIELTLKSRTRYREGIFPKYIRELKKETGNHLLYVTPSPQIKTELDTFKEFFIYKEGEELEEVFERLHIISADNFKEELAELINEDPYINWQE